ncbi:MAG: family 43 glycosylhydrolase [bacterium]|nr:family 43 glycosylhydrolase [bacterium]
MNPFLRVIVFGWLAASAAAGSPSFSTYMNPIFPGDHPDPTLSRFGDDWYTTGSSFATTPVIWHSKDLVRWEAVSQPVSNAWPLFGTGASDGIWGGHLVFHGGKYWHFFGRSARMYFVTADSPAGPWTAPREVACPASVPGLGMDNSIFIDDDGSWYLLVKNGQSNNWIVQLGDDGQPAGAILNLCWINPAPTYPYSWAEGPVMWKAGGWYYYSFAIHIYATQRVMRSRVLTDDQSEWEFLGNLFNENDPKKGSALFAAPNHCSPAVMAADSTWWIVSQSYGPSEWHGLGRQGLLSRVRHDADGKPVADFPVNEPSAAPALASGGIPWTVPRSDCFDSGTLYPGWRIVGYSPTSPWSLTARPGWIRLTQQNQHGMILQNDAEHNYSLITKVDFEPGNPDQEAGLRILTGKQTVSARLFSAVDGGGAPVICFAFGNTRHEADNTAGRVVWLKIVRVNHTLTGYFSADGRGWTRVGEPVNVASMDVQQPDYNAFTGNYQGPYVIGSAAADFDLYIYRDAYTPILAECPADWSGVSRAYATATRGYVLDNIHSGDWALYAGVEFGNADYPMAPDSIRVTASSAGSGGTVEVWLDSIDTGEKIAECAVGGTGSWKTFQPFSAAVSPVSGRHDVYLRFTGAGTAKLFQMLEFAFTPKPASAVRGGGSAESPRPERFGLSQNFPNPFNAATTIPFRLPSRSDVSLKVYDLAGREAATLVDDSRPAGEHEAVWDASSASSGIYFYRLKADGFSDMKKLVLVK